MDPTHSFGTGGRGLRWLLGMVAPGLQELRIASCSDIFHGRSLQVGSAAPLLTRPASPASPAPSFPLGTAPSRPPSPLLSPGLCSPSAASRPAAPWPPCPACPQDLAGMHQLRVLALISISRPMQPADLAPLEGLAALTSLTIHCSRPHEEATGPCFPPGGLPDPLLRLKGLRELAFTSLGGRPASSPSPLVSARLGSGGHEGGRAGRGPRQGRQGAPSLMGILVTCARPREILS